MRERNPKAVAVGEHLADICLTAIVVVPMMLFGAPTWAWFGMGAITYLHSVDFDGHE